MRSREVGVSEVKRGGSGRAREVGVGGQESWEWEVRRGGGG